MTQEDLESARAIARKVEASEEVVLASMRATVLRDPVGFDRVSAVLGNHWAWAAGVIMLLPDRHFALTDVEKVLLGGVVPAVVEGGGTWLMAQLRDYQYRRRTGFRQPKTPTNDAQLEEVAEAAGALLRGVLEEIQRRAPSQPAPDEAWERALRSPRSTSRKLPYL